MSTNPRLVRASRALSRRMFLKAIGLGLSVPLAAKLAGIATAAPTPAPKRFFLLYIPDGAPPEHFNPQIVGGDPTNFVLDQTNVSVLSPLQKYVAKKYVNVYQGFSYPGGTTHTGIVSCLSGVNTTDTTTPRTSLEHVIAKGLGVKPLILGACSHQSTSIDPANSVFWDGTQVDPEKNPAAVADRLFGSPTTQGPPSADVQLRSDLLALTAGEIQGLQSTLTGLTKETTKLQRHLEAVQALQSGPHNNGNSTCGSVNVLTDPAFTAVNAVRAGAAAAPPLDSGRDNDYFYDGANFPLLYQAQLEVAAKALICNAAQVVGLMPMWPVFELDFKFIQTDKTGPLTPPSWSHHLGLSHIGPQQASGVMYNTPLSTNNLDPMPRAVFAQAQLWFMNQLDQYVLQTLANTPDPSGAAGELVLDNTLVYVMSEIGDGQYHTTKSQIIFQCPSFLPLVSIGKCGGGLKTGQVLQTSPDNPDGTKDRPATDLYLSLCQAMGVQNATFPNSTGPIVGLAT